MKPISLGTTYDANLGAMAVPPSQLSSNPRTSYPRAYIEDYTGPELADEGEITFRYKIVSTTEETDRDGKEHCSMTMELHQILKAPAEDEMDPEETAAEAMDSKLKYRR